MRLQIKVKTSSYQSVITAIRQHVFIGFLTLFTLLTLNACGGGSPLTLTQGNVDKIQRDMTAQEVKSILGEPTETKVEPIPIVGGTKTTFVYSNKEDRVVIVLKNDNVQTKEATFSSVQ
jgi:predicted small lipoprotein YifL